MPTGEQILTFLFSCISERLVDTFCEWYSILSETESSLSVVGFGISHCLHHVLCGIQRRNVRIQFKNKYQGKGFRLRNPCCRCQTVLQCLPLLETTRLRLDCKKTHKNSQRIKVKKKKIIVVFCSASRKSVLSVLYLKSSKKINIYMSVCLLYWSNKIDFLMCFSLKINQFKRNIK